MTERSFAANYSSRRSPSGSGTKLGPSHWFFHKVWEILRIHIGLPHDAAIEVAGTRTVIYDARWTHSECRPAWYRMNHAAQPTVRMRISDQRLVWQAVTRPPRRHRAPLHIRGRAS